MVRKTNLEENMLRMKENSFSGAAIYHQSMIDIILKLSKKLKHNA